VRFVATELTGDERALQQDVRDFLDVELPAGAYEPGLGMSAGVSKELSRKLGARGWLGMALPKAYGGGERSVVERFVVVEELLRRGAPLESHWTADRQSGPVINRFGSEELKHRFLPAISRGELTFSIGMSEPDAGSDLASVACRATKVDAGYELSGTKIWTSNAHFADYAIVLCRTSDADDRHAGLSQLIVDLHSQGVTVNPIPFLDGTEDFNEVVFDGVFVPDDLLLGGEGQGWAQNTSELSFERAGPERWISPYLVVEHFVREYGDDLGVDAVRFLGDSVARWWGIRQVSLTVARMIDDGKQPSVESALGKDLGTQFEQEVMARIQTMVDVEPSLAASSTFQRLLARAVLVAPSWTVRGGTNEILRGVIARGLR
jgi:3-oxocholest-4-en-26-oyl-CoA dehydrogenase alpha subunit